MSKFNQGTWDRFCDAAAFDGIEAFPTMTELLDDRRTAAPVEFMPPISEWVDIAAEQSSSEASINAFQSTYADEIGNRGGSWRRNFYQRAKEEKLKKQLGLVSPADAMAQQAVGTGQQAAAMADATASGAIPGAGQSGGSVDGDRKLGLAEALQKIYLSVGKVISTDEARQIIAAQYGVELLPENAPKGEEAAESSLPGGSPQPTEPQATGEMAGLSTLQFNRNRKAISKILDELAAGTTSETAARVFLGSIGMAQASIDLLIDDALDGSVDELPEATPEPTPEETKRTRHDRNGIRIL